MIVRTGFETFDEQGVSDDVLKKKTGFGSVLN
jgi:hypothetical protein